MKFFLHDNKIKIYNFLSAYFYATLFFNGYISSDTL